MGVKVNGKLVSLSHKLNSGDQVEVITSKKQRPSKDWLRFVVTSRAKSKIKSALKQDKKKIAIGIVTARDDQRMIYTWLKDHLKHPIDSDLIFAVNDRIHGFRGDIADRKKEAFREIIEMGFNDLQFYDDDTANLRLVKSLEKEYPNVKISTIRAKKYHR